LREIMLIFTIELTKIIFNYYISRMRMLAK